MAWTSPESQFLQIGVELIAEFNPIVSRTLVPNSAENPNTIGVLSLDNKILGRKV